jgi:hypothetical protein
LPVSIKTFIRRHPLPLLIFFTAFIFRLLLLVFVVPLDACDDSYHHWIIHYWSLNVGFPQGRLWDLFGMEYFWGALPSLVGALLLLITFSTSLTPFRMFNILITSGTAVAAYFIVKRWRNDRVGSSIVGLTVALNPLASWETFAIYEPLGLFFFLLGILFLERSAYKSGVFFGLASACRIEFWVVSMGILIFYYVKWKLDTNSSVFFWGWFTPMLFYGIQLQIWAGSPFYPLYYNFWGNVAGGWVTPQAPPLWLYTGSIIGLISTVAYLIFWLIKREKLSFFYIPIALYFGYHSLQYSIFHVQPNWGRFFIADWALLAILICPTMLTLSTRVSGKKYFELGWSAPSAALLVVAILSIAILLQSGVYANGYSTLFQYNTKRNIESWEHIATETLKHYRTGALVTNHIGAIYYLVQHGLQASQIVSTLYCPQTSKMEVVKWLKDHGASLFLVSGDVREKGILELYPKLRNGESDPPFYFAGYAETYPVFEVNITSV